MTRAVELAQIASAGVSEAFKNRIINGAMTIDQRNSAGSPINAGSRAYGVDRWCVEKGNTSGSFTFGQSSVAPPGFTNSSVCTVTTADTSVGSNDIAWVEHHIEGYNIADLAWGTANALTMTLSFWCRSSLTGTYSVLLMSSSNNTYAANYTINSANTWEFKTIVIPGPTSGTFNTTIGSGVKFRFALMAGSSLAVAPGTWTSGDYVGSTSQVNWMATNGNTFYITGVQFEVGTSATSFEFRPFGTELLLCQRYYEEIITPYGIACSCFNSADAYANITFVTKRTSPSVNLGSAGSFYSNGSGRTVIAVFAQNGFPTSFQLRVNASGLTAGHAGHYDSSNSNIKISAEL